MSTTLRAPARRPPLLALLTPLLWVVTLRRGQDPPGLESEGALATPPSAKNPVVRVDVDAEVGREGFTHRLKSGKEGLVLADQLTLEAQTRVAESRLSRREIIRRLGTSEAQFYRLLDQLLSLLHVLA